MTHSMFTFVYSNEVRLKVLFYSYGFSVLQAPIISKYFHSPFNHLENFRENQQKIHYNSISILSIFLLI